MGVNPNPGVDPNPAQKPGETVLSPKSFPGFISEHFRDIGSMGGAGEPNINDTYQDFLIYLSALDGILMDQCIVQHEGINIEAGSGNSSSSETEANTGFHRVLAWIYLVPRGLTIAEAVANPDNFQLANRIAMTNANPEFVAFDLASSSARRRLRRGDRILIRFASDTGLLAGSSSSSETPATATIANVSVSLLGRFKQG